MQIFNRKISLSENGKIKKKMKIYQIKTTRTFEKTKKK